MMRYLTKIIALCILCITILIVGTGLVQGQVKNDNGIIITEKGDVTSFYDEFTGKYSIAVNDSSHLKRINIDTAYGTDSYYIIPFYGGDLYGQDLTKLNWIENWSNELNIFLVRDKTGVHFFDDQGRKPIRFLVDDKRVTKQANYRTSPFEELIEFSFTSSEWENILNSESTRFRISGQVYAIDQITKNLMEQILSEHQRLQRELDADQGTGYNPDLSAPYALEWEGDLDRIPMIQPLPSNHTNEEGVITIRFEVNPDGTLGRVIPLRKMNPELEREVMRTLRSWRFSRLPSDVPQDAQWGTITFRFVRD
jgi:TonB family protein